MTAEEKSIKTEFNIHHAASAVGGFWGAYALLNFCDLFGSSQTSNMIRLVYGLIIGTGVYDWLIRLGAFLVYAVSLSLTVILPKYIKMKLSYQSVIVTALCAIISALLPGGIDPELSIYPILFASAFQWNTFVNVGEYVSSSIFSTNNLKQAVTSLTDFCMTKNEKSAEKAKFYFLTLLFYHIGAAFCALSYVLLKRYGIWLIFLPLSVLTFLIGKSE